MKITQRLKRLTIWNKLGVIASIASIFGFVVSLSSINAVDKFNRSLQEEDRLKPLTYRVQIEKLNQTETNVRSLLEFVQAQRNKLMQAEDLLQSLRQEHEKLKPVLEAKRTVVNAIFDAQEQRRQLNQINERWLGFGLGVLGSLSASGIWFLCRFLLGRLKTDDTPKELAKSLKQ